MLQGYELLGVQFEYYLVENYLKESGILSL